MNTKVLFKYLPHDATLGDPQRHLPSMAHMNYHPEKEPRMLATIRFYKEHDRAALRDRHSWRGRASSGARLLRSVAISQRALRWTGSPLAIGSGSVA